MVVSGRTGDTITYAIRSNRPRGVLGVGSKVTCESGAGEDPDDLRADGGQGLEGAREDEVDGAVVHGQFGREDMEVSARTGRARNWPAGRYRRIRLSRRGLIDGCRRLGSIIPPRGY